jgi:glycosyltransferase involved in cell wall biosynthesis
MAAQGSSGTRAPVTVLIPAFNEEAGIGGVVQDIREKFVAALGRTDDEVEILVIDDGSTDRTAERARAAGADVMSHHENHGYGASIKTGLRHASHDIIVLTDADGTYPAEFMDPLVKELDTCDMSVGMRSGQRVHYPLVRRPAKWVLRRLAVFLAGKSIPDINSGLRVFRRSDALRFLNLYPRGFSFTTTITLAYLCNDLTVNYLPIDYHPRLGKSKIRPLRDTKNLFLTIIRSILFFNPLRVFVPTALLILAAAAVVLFGVRDSHGNVLDGTVTVLTLAGIQVMILGFLADVIARMRR